MAKTPITATEPEHGEGNWSAKPGPRAPHQSDTELQMLSYLRRIVDALERISLAVVNISTHLAERSAKASVPPAQPPPATPPTPSVSD